MVYVHFEVIVKIFVHEYRNIRAGEHGLLQDDSDEVGFCDSVTQAIDRVTSGRSGTVFRGCALRTMLHPSQSD
jgi:hypothetical protein